MGGEPHGAHPSQYLEQNLAACVGEGCALRSAYTLHMSGAGDMDHVRCGRQGPCQVREACRTSEKQHVIAAPGSVLKKASGRDAAFLGLLAALEPQGRQNLQGQWATHSNQSIARNMGI